MVSFLNTQQKVLTSFALSYEFIDTILYGNGLLK